MKRLFPAILFVLAFLWAASSWRPPKTAPGDFDLARFGKIPVLVGGRVKPLDTVARNSLLIIHGKQSVSLTNGNQLGAIPWLTDTLFNAPLADQYPVFVIQNADVLGLFGWEQKDRKYFSYVELSPFLKQIDEQGALSEKLQSVQRSAYQNAVLNLRNGLVLYQRLKNSLQPEGATSFAKELDSYAKGLPAAGQAARERETGKSFDKTKLDNTAELIERYQKMAEMGYILAIPAVSAQKGDWHSVGESLLQSIARGRNSSGRKNVRANR